MSEGQNFFEPLIESIRSNTERAAFRQRAKEADRVIKQFTGYVDKGNGEPWTELSFVKMPGLRLVWNESHKGAVIRTEHRRVDGTSYFTHAYVFDSQKSKDDKGEKYPLVLVEEPMASPDPLDRFTPLMPSSAREFADHYSRAFSVPNRSGDSDEVVKIGVYIKGSGEKNQKKGSRVKLQTNRQG